MIKEIMTREERKILFRIRLQQAIRNRFRKQNPLTKECVPDHSKIKH